MSLSTAALEQAATPQLFPGLTRMRITFGMQCNVRCTMCYQTDFSPKFNMDPVLYRERLREVYPQLRGVKLIGGEPTIMKNVREAARILRDYPKAKLTITTNGIQIDDFWLETFANQGKLVEVSINAATEPAYDKIVVLGNYQKVIRNVERILACRTSKTPDVHLTAVVLKENVFEIAKLIQLGADLGVDHVGFITDPILSRAGFPPYSQIRAELETAREVREKTGMGVSGLDGFEGLFLSNPAERVWSPDTAGARKMCAQPFNNAAIDWNGDVRVCGNTWVKMGNLYKQSFEEIWNGKVAQQFRKKMRNGNYTWCSPTCEDNAKPNRLALVYKYVYRIREDPKQFGRKVHQKTSQLLGTWVKVKPKKKADTAAAAPEKPKELLPIIQNNSLVAAASSHCESSGACGDD